MTNHFIRISDAKRLQALFDNVQDKLICVLFYVRKNMECNRTISNYEKVSQYHGNSIFVRIDVEKFTGDHPIIKQNIKVPKIDFYFRGTQIGSTIAQSENEINNHVKNFERQVLTVGNQEYNANANANGGNNNGISDSLNPIDAIKKRIVVETLSKNPQLCQQLVSNPPLLHMVAQAQYQKMQQQQLQSINQSTPGIENIMSMLMNNNNTSSNSDNSGFNLSNINIPNNNGTSQNHSTNSLTDPADITGNQLKLMFKIFQNMQQAGILRQNGDIIPNTEAPNTQANNTPAPNIQKQQQQAAPTVTDASPKRVYQPGDVVYVFPDGREIIALPNNKFMIPKRPR